MRSRALFKIMHLELTKRVYSEEESALPKQYDYRRIVGNIHDVYRSNSNHHETSSRSFPKSFVTRETQLARTKTAIPSHIVQ